MHGFGFTHMPAPVLRAARAELRILVFPGTEILAKPVRKSVGPPFLVPPPPGRGAGAALTAAERAGVPPLSPAGVAAAAAAAAAFGVDASPGGPSTPSTSARRAVGDESDDAKDGAKGKKGGGGMVKKKGSGGAGKRKADGAAAAGPPAKKG